jgi:hypothetical protein
MASGFEHPARQPIGAQILPDILHGVELRSAGGQEYRRDALGDVESAGRMPSGAIHEQDGVSAVSDVARYLVQMQLHGFGRRPATRAPRRFRAPGR